MKIKTEIFLKRKTRKNFLLAFHNLAHWAQKKSLYMDLIRFLEVNILALFSKLEHFVTINIFILFSKLISLTRKWKSTPKKFL